MTELVPRALAVGVVLVVAAVARAGTIATPEVYSGNPSDFVFCEANNVGTKPIKSVTVELIDNGDNTLETQNCTNLGKSALCGAYHLDKPTGVYCKVTFAGSKNNIKAVISVSDSSNVMKVVLPAN